MARSSMTCVIVKLELPAFSDVPKLMNGEIIKLGDNLRKKCETNPFLIDYKKMFIINSLAAYISDIECNNSKCHLNEITKSFIK